MTNIGFIGTGNMGGALATAVSQAEGVTLHLANKPVEMAQKLADALKEHAEVSVYTTNAEVVSKSDYLFIGVKPQNKEELAKEIKDILKDRENIVIVSMMAGVSMDKISELFGEAIPIIRIMPNLPAMVGRGMILYTANERVSKGDLDAFLRFMDRAGRFEKLDEHLFSAGSGVSGCGPAFAAMFIEALADGGVSCGLPRATAVTLAAQMCLGTAAYILENNIHPDVLKDNVCSPGGTTIQGVRSLEADGFRSGVMEAVIAACEKDKSLA